MRNNQKGITIVTLTITIILMIILVGVTTVSIVNIVDKAETQEIISNMILIQTKVKIIMEQDSFNGGTGTYYVGTKLKDVSNKSQIAGNAVPTAELDSETYYIFNEDALKKAGLEAIQLEQDEVYIVNYQNGEVYYPKGINDFNGNLIYKLSDVIN